MDFFLNNEMRKRRLPRITEEIEDLQPVKEPKIYLSRRCPCSDEVREEFNQWLIQMFGMKEVWI
jgi:hypothetical protein